jgi:urea transport system substrate-binding protein
MGPKVVPVISFSIGEQEVKAMGPSLVDGGYAAWNYFQTLDNDLNKKFVEAYKAKFGADTVITDPMIHGYLDVYVWKAAVDKAQSTDPAKVRAAAVTLDAIPTPLGDAKFMKNNSLMQTAYIGKAGADGQFEILWTSDSAIAPEPYDPVAFPGKTCEIG